MKLVVLFALFVLSSAQGNLSPEQLEVLQKIQAHFEKTVNGLPSWMKTSAQELIEKHFGRREADMDVERTASKFAISTLRPIVEKLKSLAHNKVDLKDFAKINEAISDLKDVFVDMMTKYRTKSKRQTNEFFLKNQFNVPLHVGNVLAELKQKGITNLATIKNIFTGDMVGKITNIVETGKRQVNIKTTVGGNTHTQLTLPNGLNFNNLAKFGTDELLKALGINVGKRAVKINVTNDIGGKIAGAIQHLIDNSCLKNLWRNVTINVTNEIKGDFVGIIRNIINIKC